MDSDILLIVSSQVSWDSARHVLKELVKRRCFPRILMNDAFSPAIRSDEERLVSRLLIRQEEAIRHPWKVLLSNDPINKSLINGILVSYHHGQYAESSWTTRVASKSDYYCCASESEMKYLANNLEGSIRLLTTGVPKNDQLVGYRTSSPSKREYKKNKWKSHHGIRSRHCALLTSHWSEAGLMKKYGFDLVRKIREELDSDWHLLLTCHPKFWEAGEFHADRDCRSRLRQELIDQASTGNLTLVHPSAIAEAISFSDLCICDGVSSIYLEALIAGKQVLIEKVPHLSDQDLGIELKKSVREFESLCRLPDHLKTATNDIKDKGLPSHSDKLLKLIGGNTRNASERIACIAIKLAKRCEGEKGGERRHVGFAA